MTVIVGIDPGEKGAIAFLDVETKRILSIEDMPIEAVDASKKEIDSHYLSYLLTKHGDPILVVVEKVGPVPKSRRSSAFTFGRNYEAVISSLKIGKFRWERVLPKKWQGKVLAGTDKSKKASIAWASRAYPEAKIEGKDGRSDAVALATYGLRELWKE